MWNLVSWLLMNLVGGFVSPILWRTDETTWLQDIVTGFVLTVLVLSAVGVLILYLEWT